MCHRKVKKNVRVRGSSEELFPRLNDLGWVQNAPSRFFSRLQRHTCRRCHNCSIEEHGRVPLDKREWSLSMEHVVKYCQENELPLGLPVSPRTR
jgi:hypothetical protein